MLRLTANGKHKKNVQSFDGMELLIQSQVGEYFYGYGDHTLQEVTVDLLKESGLTIACAESLTGGLFAGKCRGV